MNKENEMKMNGVEETPKTSGEWVFVPLAKKHIIKRTDTYVLFNLDGVATAIVSAKFLRKKESEDMLFMSLPSNYEVNCRVCEKTENGLQVTKRYIILPKELQTLVRQYNDLPF